MGEHYRTNNAVGHRTTVTASGVVKAIGDSGMPGILVTKVDGADVWVRLGDSSLSAGAAQTPTDDADATDRPIPDAVGDVYLERGNHTHVSFKTNTGFTAVVDWIAADKVAL